MHITFERVDWEFEKPFRIAYRTRTHAQTVLVRLTQGSLMGRGEALGVSYHGETVDTLLDQLASMAGDLRNGASRSDVQALLPPGGARNALDCAFWDLDAKRAGRRVWELLGLDRARPLTTAYTLGVDTPEAMGAAAAVAKTYSLLKLKLMGEGDLARVASVRDVRPDARLIVDANQSWNVRQLHEFVPRLAELAVELIEQPLPAGDDLALSGFSSAVPLCADESCQTVESLPATLGKYQYINIKLDKTGGLTEALQLAGAARAAGLNLMVGCMGGSSLSMAPAFVVGQLCDIADLDGPLLAKADVPEAIRYEGDRVTIPQAQLWG